MSRSVIEEMSKKGDEGERRNGEMKDVTCKGFSFRYDPVSILVPSSEKSNASPHMCGP